MVKLKDMFGILECLFYLETVVVYPYDLTPRACHVVGEDIPWLRRTTALWATDDPEGQSVERDRRITAGEPLHFSSLATLLDIAFRRM